MNHHDTRNYMDQVFAELQTQGLSPTHAAMGQNIVEYRIRGSLPYHNYHKTELLERIRQVTPDMVGKVEQVFKNLGK